MEARNKIVDGWRQKADELKKNKLDEWVRIYPRLIRVVPFYRQEILDAYYKDEAAAIQEIASSDALAGLPVLIKIFESIKLENDKALDACFQKMNIELLRTPVLINEYMEEEDEQGRPKKEKDKIVKEFLSDRFAPYLGRSIIEIFEDFIFHQIPEREDLEKLKTQFTEKVLTEKVDAIISEMLDQLIAKHPAKKDQIKAARAEIIRLLRTEIFVSCAIKAFLGADNAQKMYSLGDKLAFWRKYTHIELRKPFFALTFCVKNLEIPPELNEPWHEVSIFLEGFFQRVRNMMLKKYGEIKKDKYGNYEIVDQQDYDLKNNFKGLTKYAMAEYYESIYKVLKTKLKPKNQIPHILKVPPKPRKIVVRPTNEGYLPKKLQHFMEEGKGKFTDREKIDFFRRFVDSTLPFTEKQVLILSFLHNEIKLGCAKYTANNGWMNLFFKGKINSTHTRLATDLPDRLEDMDPQDQLKELYKTRDSLKNSKRMRSIMDDIILKAFNQLLIGVPLAIKEEMQQKVQGLKKV